MFYTLSLIQIDSNRDDLQTNKQTNKQTKNLLVALSKEVTEMLQEIKEHLWHRQVLKVNRVNNFINLLFFWF